MGKSREHLGMTDHDKALWWYKRRTPVSIRAEFTPEIDKEFKKLYGSYFDENGKQCRELKP